MLLLRTYYRYEAPPIEAPDISIFCSTLAADANRYAESDPERVTEEELAGVVGASGKPIAESDLAFAYLDVGALQYMGVIPRGTPFEAWYRNFGESSMMYVVGDNFAVYVSRNWTTLSEEDFYRLPTLQGVIPETYCFADWCSGPGPTPTPTGQVPTPTPGAAPGGTHAKEVLFLQQDHVLLPAGREVIEDAGPHHPAADDDDIGRVRNFTHKALLRESCVVLAASSPKQQFFTNRTYAVEAKTLAE